MLVTKEIYPHPNTQDLWVIYGERLNVSLCDSPKIWLHERSWESGLILDYLIDYQFIKKYCKGIFETENREKTQAKKRRSQYVLQSQRLRWCGQKSRNPWRHMKLEEDRKDSPMETSEVVWSYWHLDFKHLYSRARRK